MFSDSFGGSHADSFGFVKTVMKFQETRCFGLTCSCNGLSPDAAAAAIVDGMNCMG